MSATTAERVRIGFWRIAILGIWGGTVLGVVMLAGSIYGLVSTTHVDVHVRGGVYVAVPVSLTDDQALAIVRKVHSDTSVHSQDVRDVMRQVIGKKTRAWQEPLTTALILMVVGVLWFGCWWVIGWVLRGFLG